jgi:hypothetical protein
LDKTPNPLVRSRRTLVPSIGGTARRSRSDSFGAFEARTSCGCRGVKDHDGKAGWLSTGKEVECGLRDGIPVDRTLGLAMGTDPNVGPVPNENTAGYGIVSEAKLRQYPNHSLSLRVSLGGEARGGRIHSQIVGMWQSGETRRAKCPEMEQGTRGPQRPVC